MGRPSILPLLIFLLASTGYSDIYSTYRHLIKPSSYTKIGHSIWGAGGAGVARKGLTGIELINPAGLKNDRFSIAAEVGHSYPQVTVIGDVKSPAYTYLPTYISIGSRYKNWNWGLGYLHHYQNNLSTQIQVIDVSNPDGNGEYYTHKLESSLHRAFISFSTVILPNLRIGSTFFYSIYKDITDLGHPVNKRKVIDLSYPDYLIGVNYDIKNKLSFGLSLKSDVDSDIKETTYQLSPSKLDPTLEINSPESIKIRYKVMEPGEIKAGVSFQIRPKMKFHFSASKMNWEKYEQSTPNGNETFTPAGRQFNYGISWKSISNHSFQLGYFNASYKIGTLSESIEQYTLGVTLQVSDKVELSILTIPIIWNKLTSSSDSFDTRFRYDSKNVVRNQISLGLQIHI